MEESLGKQRVARTPLLGSRAPMSISIIIPAHNEETVLEPNLRALLDGLGEDVEVLVVCNGCSDDSAAVASQFAPRVKVLDIEEASKVAALNAGDAQATHPARIYLDADVALSGTSAQRLVATLESGAHAAEPTAEFERSRSSFSVRAFYAVWLALHGRKPGDVGCGVCAVSAAGRARFGAFPDVISDDGYLRAHFAPEEITRVPQAQVVIQAPRTLQALLAIKTRSRLGAAQLEQRFPELWREKRGSGASLQGKLTRLPFTLWPLVPIYAAIQISARRRAAAADLQSYRWERDTTTR